MPLQKLQFTPGVNREATNYANSGGWFEADKVRWRSGYPEKIGGWVLLSTATYQGVARALINWVLLDGDNLLGVGTNLKYYIERGGAYSDITPIRREETLTDPFTTFVTTLDATINATVETLTVADATDWPVSGVIKIDNEEILYRTRVGTTLSDCERGHNSTVPVSHTVGADVLGGFILVEDPVNGAADNDFVIFSGATGFAGLSAPDLNKEFQIFGSSVDAYYIATSVFPNAADTGGGTVDAEYQITTGLEIYVVGTGWGAPPWGAGGWGDSYAQGNIGLQLRLWNHGIFGEDLVFGPRGGAIYYWDATTGLTSRGVDIVDLPGSSDAPIVHNWLLVSDVSRFVIALGANPLGETAIDPMLVRWSDQESITDWTPSATNQAGDLRLSNGSEIITAVTMRQENLVLTDSAVYSMKYEGPPFVWGFQMLADNISIISPNAVVVANNIAYWMGVDKFYTYSGRVQTLPSALWEYVYSDINLSQGYQSFGSTNEGFNEIWWFYCSSGSTTVDKYVIYNYVENTWSYGFMPRTAWLDSALRSSPMAAAGNRIAYQEVGTDDGLTNPPSPIVAFAQSSDFDIGDGHNFGFVWRMIPDVTFTGSTVINPAVTIELRPRQFSGSPYGAAERPVVTRTARVPVELYTPQVYVRVRGRQMSFRIESSGIGVGWQLGAPRIDIKPDGRR